MDLLGEYNLTQGIAENTTEAIVGFSEVIFLVAGISLGIVIVEVIVGLFYDSQSDTIEVMGERITQKQINEKPIEWFRSLSESERERVARFDREKARESMLMD